MSIKINFKKSGLKKSTNNLILFVSEEFNINPIRKFFSNFEFSYIDDL